MSVRTQPRRRVVVAVCTAAMHVVATCAVARAVARAVACPVTRAVALRASAMFAMAMFAAALSACVSPSTAPDAVNEQWRYAGVQRVPTALQLDGALRITSRSGERFEGSLDLRRTDALGQVERVTGLVSGRGTNTTLDFEAMLDGAVVRHIGRVRGDSVTGTWLDDDSGGAAVVSGSFTLVRAP